MSGSSFCTTAGVNVDNATQKMWTNMVLAASPNWTSSSVENTYYHYSLGIVAIRILNIETQTHFAGLVVVVM